MAGDWIKMECNLPDKPEVLAITAAMGWDDPDLTVGKLMRMFRWFDQHTTDGNARGVTATLLDRVVCASGFVQAMQNVGWMVVSEAGLSLKNFDRHNGSTAKTRAQTAKRVAVHRASAAGNAEGNAPTVTTPLAREEKRREEEQPSVVGAAKPRPVRKAPESFLVDADLQQWARENVPGVDIRAETAKFRDHTFRTAITDWPGAWRNWMRRAAEELARRPAQRAANDSLSGVE